MREPDQKFKCLICLGLPSDPVVTKCGHMFCYECLSYWLLKYHSLGEGSCPTCKKYIKLSDCISLYTGDNQRSQTHRFSDNDEEDVENQILFPYFGPQIDGTSELFFPQGIIMTEREKYLCHLVSILLVLFLTACMSLQTEWLKLLDSHEPNTFSPIFL